MSRLLEPSSPSERIFGGLVCLAAAGLAAALLIWALVSPAATARPLLAGVALLALAVTGPAAWRALRNRPRPEGGLIPVWLLALVGTIMFGAAVAMQLAGEMDWHRNAWTASAGAVALIEARRRHRSRRAGA